MSSRNKLFRSVNALHPQKHRQNMSNEIVFDCYMGQLIPVYAQKCIPGDSWSLSIQSVIRFQPLFAPIMHQIHFTAHSFFVPTRILYQRPEQDDNGIDDPFNTFLFEDFITGGINGDDDQIEPAFNPSDADNFSIGSLLDFLYGALPINPQPGGAQMTPTVHKLRAYNLIYNEYYRDRDLVDWYDLNDPTIKYRAWTKDYFTASRPWQQRGTSPSIPLAVASASVNPGTDTAQPVGLYDADNNRIDSAAFSFNYPNMSVTTPTGTSWPIPNAFAWGTSLASQISQPGVLTLAYKDTDITNMINNLGIDVSLVADFDIADLRTAIAIQNFLERNSRIGSRYTEHIYGRWGVNPGDARLNRPEYIGGTRSPIITSEVLQTSSTQSGQSPQGTMAGHGINAASGNIGRYFVREHGYILTIISITPQARYEQGLNRQDLTRSRYDYPTPEFVHLSEQGIYPAEIYWQYSSTYDDTPLGYQGYLDEYRQVPNKAHGNLRTEGSLYYWTIARHFTSTPPLNSEFITIAGNDDSSQGVNRIFASPNDPVIIANIGNLCYADRPIPAVPEPGLMDHTYGQRRR